MWKSSSANSTVFMLRGDGEGASCASPCIPRSWNEFSIQYRYGSAVYAIEVRRRGNGSEVTRVAIDGVESADRAISLVDDGQRHNVAVELG